MPIRRKIKNVVANYSAAELLVRDATSNDPSLPDEFTMLKIADATKISYYYDETTRMIFKRLNDKSKNWRHIYKALLVIEVCLKNGSLAFVKDCLHQAHQITTLTDFVYLGEEGADAGRLVREQAKRVTRLLSDNAILHEERKLARVQRTKARQEWGISRSRSASLCSYEPDYPTREGVAERSYSYAKNDSEEAEQIRMAMRLSLAEMDEKSREVLQANALLEKHNPAADVDNLLDLSDGPPLTEQERQGFDEWLAHRKWNVNQITGSQNTGMMPPMPAPTLKQRAEQAQKQHQQQQQQQPTMALGELDLLDFGAASQSKANSPAATTSAFSPDMMSVADVNSSAFFKSDPPESPSQKTPVDPAVKFLGEHANLINLEKLITPTPVCPVKTEPPKPSLFDLSSSNYQQPSWNNGPFTQQPANFLNQQPQQLQPFQGMSSQTYMQRSQTLQPAFTGLGPIPQQQPSLFSNGFGSPMQTGPNSQPNGINGFGAGGSQWTGGAGTLQPSAFPPAASAAQINPFL
ncbi:hypothetical protein AAHC03_023023 [Spirometra sp. Aus1]